MSSGGSVEVVVTLRTLVHVWEKVLKRTRAWLLQKG